MAPVFPAETNASAFPVLTRFIPTPIELLILDLEENAGASSVVILSGA